MEGLKPGRKRLHMTNLPRPSENNRGVTNTVKFLCSSVSRRSITSRTFRSWFNTLALTSFQLFLENYFSQTYFCKVFYLD